MEIFPFAAIVGMEKARRSMVSHAVDPKIGGVLLMGHRGCAKSTLARAFARLLPGDAPFVEVPLGVSEDRLLGSVDAEHLVEGRGWRSRQGLIESANGGILYIDEVNLLPDAMADHLLDASASGSFRMERDGHARVAESRFILVGTMNPDEGELRPQLCDRFAHGINVSDDFTEEERVEIVRRRMAYDDDPARFVASFYDETAKLQTRVVEARARLAVVRIPDGARLAIAAKARGLALEGVRAELAVVRTARALAAWEGAGEIGENHIAEAWDLCLGHRQTHEPPPSGQQPPRDGRPPEPKQTLYAGQPPAPRDARPGQVLARARLSSEIGELQVSETVGRPAAQGAGGEGAPDWVATGVRRVLGWLAGERRVQLVRRRIEKRPGCWVFFDASRSCGASGFLDAASQALRGMAARHGVCRWHILALRGSGMRWLARGAGRAGLGRALDGVGGGSGRSPLGAGLKQLFRARANRAGACDRAWVITDGCETAKRSGAKGGEAWGMRAALKKIARAMPCCWVAPAGATSAASRRVQVLAAGTGAAVRELFFSAPLATAQQRVE